MEGPVATEVFCKNLADWKKEKPDALLDLIEGAEAKKSDETFANCSSITRHHSTHPITSQRSA